jgi:hypothetical protein
VLDGVQALTGAPCASCPFLLGPEEAEFAYSSRSVVLQTTLGREREETLAASPMPGEIGTARKILCKRKLQEAAAQTDQSDVATTLTIKNSTKTFGHVDTGEGFLGAGPRGSRELSIYIPMLMMAPTNPPQSPVSCTSFAPKEEGVKACPSAAHYLGRVANSTDVQQRQRELERIDAAPEKLGGWSV